MRRGIILAAAVLIGTSVLSSCGGSGSDEEGEGGFDVVTDVVSDASSRDLLVFAPDAGGPWPVIVAFHGIDGTAHDMAELSTRLAREGAVVFAPNYRIVVGISGGHYGGGDLDLVDTEGWRNEEAGILLLGGEADTECPAWQTRKAAAEMRAADYDVQLLMLEGADHFEPVFHRFVDGEMVLEPDAPAGARVVDLVMGAIAERQGRT